MPSPETATSRFEHSSDALAHSVSGSTWRAAFRIGPADATIAPAIRVGLAAAVVLIVGGLLGYQALAGFAALGAVCAAFGRYEPYPRLAGKLAMVGAALVASVAFGGAMGLVGVPVWMQIGALSLLAGVAYCLMSGFRITGPGPVILVFAATGAAGFTATATATATASDLIRLILAGALGVLVGWVAAMLPALVLPMGPARLAVARAVAAVGRLEQTGEPGVAPTQASIAHARLVIASSGRIKSTVGHGRELVAVLDAADAAVNAWREHGDPALIRDIALHEQELRKLKRSSMIEHTLEPASEMPVPDGYFVAGLSRMYSREVRTNAARIVLASAVAGWLAVGAGLEHPMWASMGAVAAMQGLNYKQTVQRGIQRLAGNVVGAVIAVGLIAMTLGYWQAVVAVVILQCAAELLVIRNYALTSLAVTPMALVLIGLSGPITTGSAVARVADTLIGVVVGVVVGAVTISRTDRHHVLR
ncbi:FUSC family protein [Rhodococcus sp. IEGM 1379]|uniref:FUSC family protein n=1 Tax=Rhodococcus sp. IEGM 1379 TaxID=3047086 RepID=UPI0024B71000|nr:FUSC family protein [Rhodococcus sp. IEGM 1379]MDI9914015.1 FUSC family protein [Rhodococcus sp. IEGM 1379]